MSRYLMSSALLFASLICGGQARAVALSLDHVGPLHPEVGDTFAYQLRLSGLDPLRSPDELLAGFQASMTFNAEIVNFERVQFSSLLGDPDLFEAVTFVNTPAPNSLTFGNVSLLDSLFLEDLQRDPVTGDFLDSLLLAAVVFSGELDGTSPINLFDVVFSDPLGNALFPELTDGLVISQSVTVPAPGTVLLLGVGLIGLCIAVTRRRDTAFSEA